MCNVSVCVWVYFLGSGNRLSKEGGERERREKKRRERGVRRRMRGGNRMKGCR